MTHARTIVKLKYSLMNNITIQSIDTFQTHHACSSWLQMAKSAFPNGFFNLLVLFSHHCEAIKLYLCSGMHGLWS